MSFNDVHFSSKCSSWNTPVEVFEYWNDVFQFELDAAASSENALCKSFYSIDDDSLSKRWTDFFSVWCNPPYGRDLYKWIRKAFHSSLNGTNVVLLLPARTDTKWFHEIVLPYAYEVVFIKGRLKFSGSKHNAPFPSMVIIFLGR